MCSGPVQSFDRVQFSALFLKLMDRNIPRNIVVLLARWYHACSAVVRWNTCISQLINITAGVRQGGILSQYLFVVFVDDALQNLSDSKMGCRFRGMMCNAIMYADDLMLLSITLHDLQAMIKLCQSEFSKLALV